MKALAVSSLKAEHPLPALLEAAGLARSTYFYHQARMDRPDPQARLKDAIKEAFARARGRYGHRRIHTMLARQGWVVAKKTVLALMRKLCCCRHSHYLLITIVVVLLLVDQYHMPHDEGPTYI